MQREGVGRAWLSFSCSFSSSSFVVVLVLRGRIRERGRGRGRKRGRESIELRVATICPLAAAFENENENENEDEEEDEDEGGGRRKTDVDLPAALVAERKGTTYADCSDWRDFADESKYPRRTTMTSPYVTRWTLLLAANALLVGVRTSGAAPQSGQPPFNNSVEQREAQVRELREIKELLKEQNALLKAGADKLNAANPR
jgi:hypothetical protein